MHRFNGLSFHAGGARIVDTFISTNASWLVMSMEHTVLLTKALDQSVVTRVIIEIVHHDE